MHFLGPDSIGGGGARPRPPDGQALLLLSRAPERCVGCSMSSGLRENEAKTLNLPGIAKALDTAHAVSPATTSGILAPQSPHG